MAGANLRALFAALSLLLLAPLTAFTPAHAQGAEVGARFDVTVAEAKASMMADPARTIAKAKAAEAVAASLPGRQRVVSIATAQWLEAEGYLRLNDPDHAGPLIDSALAAVSTGGPPIKLNGDLLLSRGALHMARSDVAGALADYQAAHAVFRDLGETRSRAIALVTIGLLYQEAEDYENALKYSYQATDVYHADPAMLVTIYNNRGVCLKELGRYSEAEAQFDKAMVLARSMNSPDQQFMLLRNMARNELAAGKFAAADHAIAQGFRVANSVRGVPQSEQMWTIAATAAYQEHKLALARAMIEHTFAGVDIARTTINFREAHQTAFLIYRALGDQAKALEHLEAQKRLDDGATTLARSTNTALAAARFDFANQELKIAKLKADVLQRNIDNERARAETQRLIFIAAAAVTVVIVAMLGFGLITIRRSRNDVRAANIDLAATNSALGKALAAKTEFLATTSHEIRTPLNGILGMTQVMLADRKLDDATRDRIQVVHGAGVSMRALVDDILDVAKMETGNMTIERLPLDLKATLMDVARMWEEQARGRDIGFALDLAECPDRIMGDAARLRQVAFNLLSNALKFTSKGEIGLRASVGDEEGSPQLRIAVSDSGIGIPADKHEIIFESFRQVDAGTTRKFGGTGLGLAICRNLARAMGGDVTVQSEPGSGSVFTLALPLDLSAEKHNETEEEVRALLILDRNPITRSMLRAVMEPRAGKVLFAGTVDEAIGLMRAGEIGQVLIDDATIKASEDVSVSISMLGTAAEETGIMTNMLWPAPADDERAAFLAAGIGAVIAKPIAGAALLSLLYPLDKNDTEVAQHLVTQAA